MTTWPGSTSAEFTAEPQPVPTPQPSRHMVSRGTSSGTFTQFHSDTTEYSENVEIIRNWWMSWPSWCMR
jgi:hypothetical protein